MKWHSTLARFQELGLHHQTQISVIPKTYFFCEGDFLPLHMAYSQCILTLIERAILKDSLLKIDWSGYRGFSLYLFQGCKFEDDSIILSMKLGHFMIFFSAQHLPSRLGMYNTPTASLQRGKTHTMSILDMTLNNLMVKFQQCWSFGECGVPLHCHRSQVHSGPEWLHLIRVQSMG